MASGLRKVRGLKEDTACMFLNTFKIIVHIKFSRTWLVSVSAE